MLLYEGKAKRIYETDNANVVRVAYKDETTAFNGEKKSQIQGKGSLNNAITSLLFARLRREGIDSHFIEKISATEQLAKRVEIIAIEVVVRNTVAGSLAKRLGIAEGTSLSSPIVEFYYKNDDLGDPLLNEDHIGLLQLASLEQLEQIRQQALRVNDTLTMLFADVNVQLVDFKLEFGLNADNQLLLADEISPDTCRLWDMQSEEKLDKDVFRRDLGDVAIAYREILRRLEASVHV